MRWEEMRSIYPKQFLHLKILSSKICRQRIYVSEVSLIRTISNADEALQILFQCRDNTIVFHTKEPKIVMPIATRRIITLPKRAKILCN